MSFLKSSVSFSRFCIVDDVTPEILQEVPNKLRQFAFRDIDDLAEERSFGWANFDDMLDTDWNVSPPEKGEYIVFSLRLETRRIPPAVLKKQTTLALREEERKIKEMGKNFVSRERKKEITEQVKLRLLARFLPIPAEFQIVWNTSNNIVYFSSVQTKMIDMFSELFLQSFGLRLELITAYSQALQLVPDSEALLAEIQPAVFI